MFTSTVARLLCCVSLLAACTALQAALREDQLDVRVQVRDMYGKEIAQAIKVTVFFDDAWTKPVPVLVLNHGRAVDPVDRAKVGRARFSDASKFFVKRGFMVAVPTRVGYGVSGGEDVEYSGACNRKNYAPGYTAAAVQTLAVLDAMRQRPGAAPDRAVVVGQSYGGTTAVTIASLNPTGVQASINFAGGGGGNPKTQPEQPCAQQSLHDLFRGYGQTAHMPMLWIYTANDRYFGPRLPKEWFDAYVSAGAKAEFEQFPAHGEDGHLLFARFPLVWQPRVAAFLDALGFTVATERNP
jgi:dienelactone hydrolase